MKKIFWVFCFLSIHTVSFADDCFVIGFHQPGTTIYNGPTICKGVKTNNLTVYGPLSISDSTVAKTITVSGPVDSVHATLGDITIRPQFYSQSVTLKGTVVSGNIHFEGKPGLVVLDKNSSIRGQVINGKIKQS
jgi:hypothetical protein